MPSGEGCRVIDAIDYADLRGRKAPRTGRMCQAARANEVCQAINAGCNQVGLAVIARHWAVERRLAWINRDSRLAKDFEKTIESVKGLLYAASSVLLLRRLAR